MIAVDSDCPRWLRELDRFLSLKSLLFIHGNILDLVSYPVRKEESDEIYWTENDLPAFFQRYLTGLGYQVIGFFDPVDGLSFAETEMEKRFDQIKAGKVMSSEDGWESDSAGNDNTRGDARDPSAARGASRQLSGGASGSSGRRGNSDINKVVDDIRSALANRQVPCAFTINLSSRLLTSPSRINRDERILFTKLLKASLESRVVYRDGKQWSNVLILICDKLNDLPPFLYINNPRTRSIYIDKPDTLERGRFISNAYRGFYHPEGDPQAPQPEFIAQFSALTEGLSNYELKSLVRLSNTEKQPLENIKQICERYKYGITESEWDKLDRSGLEGLDTQLRQRIKGQDIAIARVMDIIKRARIGLAAGSTGKSSRPRGVLFFAGPTGVGKTELTKVLAEGVFGSEDRLLRFDMSEYGAPHADQKLLGSPPGYVGYDQGGQLTNAVRENPFSILLFDEIDKAHESIFEKFLQILDDGRLTDGQGETVYFSESIIIFTSNLGIVPRGRQGDEGRRLIDPEKTSYDEMRATIMRSIEDFFNFELGRPEILNRFGDNFVIFDFIRPPVDRMIIEILVNKLIEAAREERDISLQIAPVVLDELTKLGKEYLKHGGRGLRNILDSALVNPLNRTLFDQDIQKGEVRVIELIDHGVNVAYRYEITVAT